MKFKEKLRILNYSQKDPALFFLLLPHSAGTRVPMIFKTERELLQLFNLYFLTFTQTCFSVF